MSGKISIHVPREGDDSTGHWRSCCAACISIHVPREGDDRSGVAGPDGPQYFYPRPPRGGRRRPSLAATSRSYFYPRPPRGGRRGGLRKSRRKRNISIHVPREGDDPCHQQRLCRRTISIHVPREGDDPLSITSPTTPSVFLSTSPARGTTPRRKPGFHRPKNFYPRPPRGGRPSAFSMAASASGFLSTSPARGTTIGQGVPMRKIPISIHVPREGDDRFKSHVSPHKSISIHVPREGDDVERDSVCCVGRISIHVPREGDDCKNSPQLAHQIQFLSTSPARGTTTRPARPI